MLGKGSAKILVIIYSIFCTKQQKFQKYYGHRCPWYLTSLLLHITFHYPGHRLPHADLHTRTHKDAQTCPHTCGMPPQVLFHQVMMHYIRSLCLNDCKCCQCWLLYHRLFYGPPAQCDIGPGQWRTQLNVPVEIKKQDRISGFVHFSMHNTALRKCSLNVWIKKE